MRRIILELTTAAVTVGMMIATALPAFAGSGGATNVSQFDCNLIDGNDDNLTTKTVLATDDDLNGNNTVTPSGNINMNCHYHPDTNP